MKTRSLKFRHRQLSSVVALSGLGLVAAACGSAGSTNAAATGTTPGSVTPAKAAVVSVSEVKSSKFGDILVTGGGMTLYYFTLDKPSALACTGPCLQYWPPLLLPAGVTTPVAGAGATSLGTVRRSQGLQVTYRGRPLYTFAGDHQPGEINGQGVKQDGGQWFVATAATVAIAAKAGAASSVPTTSPGTASPMTTAPQGTTPATSPAVVSPSATQPSVTTPAPTTPPDATPPPTTPPRTTPPTSPPATSPPSTSPPTTVPSGGYGY